MAVLCVFQQVAKVTASHLNTNKITNTSYEPCLEVLSQEAFQQITRIKQKYFYFCLWCKLEWGILSFSTEFFGTISIQWLPSIKLLLQNSITGCFLKDKSFLSVHAKTYHKLYMISLKEVFNLLLLNFLTEFVHH